MAALFGKTWKSTDLEITNKNLQGRRKVDHPATKSVNTTKQSFRKGQRKALGVAQVMLGLFFIAIGIPLFQSPPSIASDAAIPWWGGGFFIISGFMSIYAERKLTYLILRCCAVSNLLSAAASLSAFLLFAMDLRKWVPHVTCNDKTSECKSDYVNLSESHFSLRIIILLLALMELSLSIIVSITGWYKVWDHPEKGGELQQSYFDQNHIYESMIKKEATYTSMRDLKPNEVPALEK